MPLDPPVMTATLPSSFPMTSPSDSVFGRSGRPPRTSRWVRRRQALSAEARTSVVRNRSGWTTDASRDDRRPPFGGRALIGMGYDNRPAPPTYEMLFDVLDTGFGRRPPVPD